MQRPEHRLTFSLIVFEMTLSLYAQISGWRNNDYGLQIIASEKRYSHLSAFIQARSAKMPLHTYIHTQNLSHNACQIFHPDTENLGRHYLDSCSSLGKYHIIYNIMNWIDCLDRGGWKKRSNTVLLFFRKYEVEYECGGETVQAECWGCFYSSILCKWLLTYKFDLIKTKQQIKLNYTTHLINQANSKTVIFALTFVSDALPLMVEYVKIIFWVL